MPDELPTADPSALLPLLLEAPQLLPSARASVPMLALTNSSRDWPVRAACCMAHLVKARPLVAGPLCSEDALALRFSVLERLCGWSALLTSLRRGLLEGCSAGCFCSAAAAGTAAPAAALAEASLCAGLAAGVLVMLGSTWLCHKTDGHGVKKKWT